MHRTAQSALSVLPLALCVLATAQTPTAAPWQNTALSPEQRAELVLKAMTLDEKIALLHGTGQPGQGPVPPEQVKSNGGAGFVVGVPRLGIPGLQMADAAYGVTKSGENGRYSTALPSNLGLAASWSEEAGRQYGALIGQELRAQGYNMTLGGGVDLARELRNGRNFEYGGEDPLLAGIMVGTAMKALQAENVVGDVKHFAVNDQESGRTAVNSRLDERALRETDLLAFQLAIQTGQPGAVMCSYNRVNGDYACENKHLLTDVLRTDWGFKGFVLSDWGGTHSTVKASHAGLDQEQPNQYFFGEPYKKAVLHGDISMAELDEHVLHILFAEFASGVADHPTKRSVVNPETGAQISQNLAESSVVLLKNEHGVLPIDSAKVRSIAVIGLHADVGMLSGGGSAQVDPPGGNAILPPGQGGTTWMAHIWFPTSPLAALRLALPNVKIEFASGEDPKAAADLARRSDMAIVFAYQWESEAMDLKSLALPDGQDEVIQSVAVANPRTVVVLETGSAVLMPWIGKVSAVAEAWYGGVHAGPAIARVLTGEVNPSGKLPITFPLAEADLPHPELVPPPAASTADFYGAQREEHDRAGLPAFDVTYDEGLLVGYKWYEARGKQVLFPFGHGLSYTTFTMSHLVVAPDGRTATITVANTGKRSGRAVAQVYVSLPAGTGEPKRLAGWGSLTLAPGEHREVSVAIEPLTLSIYDLAAHAFTTVAGSYEFRAGASSADLPLVQTVSLKGK